MAENETNPAFEFGQDAGSGLPAGVGPRLRAAREASGQSLAQMAEQTKIPARMLELIEAGNFAALPARTYATGFTRSYARALGLDEVAYVAAVRTELGMGSGSEPRLASDFEPGDPARVPTARFAWLAGLAALIVLIVGLFLWRTYYAPAVTLPPLTPDEVATQSAAAAPEQTVDATALPGEEATAQSTAQSTASAAPTFAPLRHPPAQVHRSPPTPAPAGPAVVPAAPPPAPASTISN